MQWNGKDGTRGCMLHEPHLIEIHKAGLNLSERKREAYEPPCISFTQTTLKVLQLLIKSDGPPTPLPAVTHSCLFSNSTTPAKKPKTLTN